MGGWIKRTPQSYRPPFIKLDYRKIFTMSLRAYHQGTRKEIEKIIKEYSIRSKSENLNDDDHRKTANKIIKIFRKDS